MKTIFLDRPGVTGRPVLSVVIMICIALFGTACGSAGIEGTATVTEPDTAVAQDDTAEPAGVGDAESELPSSLEGQPGSLEPTETDAPGDGSEESKGRQSDPSTTSEESSSRSPEADDATSDPDPSNADATSVAAEATTTRTFECPVGSDGNPSKAAPHCMTTAGVDFPATATESLSCPTAYSENQSGQCTLAVTDAERFVYSCPDEDTFEGYDAEIQMEEQGSGPALRCTLVVFYYVDDVASDPCDPGETFVRKFEFEGQNYRPSGIELCTKPGPPEMVPAGVVDYEIVCFEGTPDIDAGGAHICIVEREGSVAATIVETPQCPRGSNASQELGVTTCLWPNGDKSAPEIVNVPGCPDGEPVVQGGAVTKCVVTRFDWVYAEIEEVVACEDSEQVGTDDNGRPLCSRPSAIDRLPNRGGGCPPQSTATPDGCRKEFDREAIAPIARRCPAGQAASPSQSGSSCKALRTVEGTVKVDYTCPAGAESDGSGPSKTCSTRRAQQIDAVEITVVTYTCPAGSTGSPTEANPFCSKATS